MKMRVRFERAEYSMEERYEQANDFIESAAECTNNLYDLLTKSDLDMALFGRWYMGAVEDYSEFIKVLKNIQCAYEFCDSEEMQEYIRIIGKFMENSFELKRKIEDITDEICSKEKILIFRMIVLLEHSILAQELGESLLFKLKNAYVSSYM